MPTEQEFRTIQTINQSLAQNLLDASRRAIDYLSLTNGGAVVACLAFIGSSSPNAHSEIVRVLLAMFLVSLIATGIALARGAMMAYGITVDFQKKSFAFMSGASTAEQLMRDLRERANPDKIHKSARWNVILLLGSFCVFVIGAVGACAWLILCSA